MLPVFEGLDQAYVYLTRECLCRGRIVQSLGTKSPGARQLTKEINHAGFTLARPQARLLYNPLRSASIFSCVARFLWNIAGNNRLAPLQFYEPIAAQFSDDNLSIAGSCEGMRLRNARFGLDQLQEAVAVLKDDRSSRRASCVLYFPEDVGRDSKDIPCTLSITFLIRDGKLETTVVMRSNNIVGVLPYDVFFFSMLAELMAKLVGVCEGAYHHFMIAAQVFERDFALAERIAALPAVAPGPLMSSMPALDNMNALLPLLEYVESIRSFRQDQTWLAALVTQIENDVEQKYWQDFAKLLLLSLLLKANQQDNLIIEIDRLTQNISEPLRSHAIRARMRMKPQSIFQISGA